MLNQFAEFLLTEYQLHWSQYSFVSFLYFGRCLSFTKQAGSYATQQQGLISLTQFAFGQFQQYISIGRVCGNSVKIQSEKTEPSKNLTSVQAVFRQKLRAIHNSD